MDGDTSQEDGLAIQQNVVALHFDGAEADHILQVVVAGNNLDVIQLRIFRRPTLEIRRLEREDRSTLSVRRCALGDVQIRNFDGDRRASCGVNHVDPSADRRPVAALQL